MAALAHADPDNFIVDRFQLVYVEMEGKSALASGKEF